MADQVRNDKPSTPAMPIPPGVNYFLNSKSKTALRSPT
jgi:hypothetical protein